MRMNYTDADGIVHAKGFTLSIIRRLVMRVWKADSVIQYTFLAVLILPVLCFRAKPVFAAESYTPAQGGSFSFHKYLIMNQSDTVPDATFSFLISPGNEISVNSTDYTGMRVLPGGGTPVVTKAVFSSSDPTETMTGTHVDVQRTNEQRCGIAGDTVQLNPGEKFALKTVTVSFEGVSFDQPGIYRYIIAEEPSRSNVEAGIVQDTDAHRILDVYVTDSGNGTLSVSTYHMYTGADSAAKTDGFTNEYTTKDLKIQKEVSGSQASRDKFFEFTVTVTGIVDNETYVVSLADDGIPYTNDGNADSESGSNAATISANQNQKNPVSVTGAQLMSGQKFYLQHGQSIVIRGLAPDAMYTVVENAEDYQSAIMEGKTNTGRIGTVAGENKMAEAGFTNTRAGMIPTGISDMAIPYLMFMLCGGAGMAGIVVKNRKNRSKGKKMHET